MSLGTGIKSLRNQCELVLVFAEAHCGPVVESAGDLMQRAAAVCVDGEVLLFGVGSKCAEDTTQFRPVYCVGIFRAVGVNVDLVFIERIVKSVNSCATDVGCLLSALRTLSPAAIRIDPTILISSEGVGSRVHVLNKRKFISSLGGRVAWKGIISSNNFTQPWHIIVIAFRGFIGGVGTRRLSGGSGEPSRDMGREVRCTAGDGSREVFPEIVNIGLNSRSARCIGYNVDVDVALDKSVVRRCGDIGCASTCGRVKPCVEVRFSIIILRDAA